MQSRNILVVLGIALLSSLAWMFADESASTANPVISSWAPAELISAQSENSPDREGTSESSSARESIDESPLSIRVLDARTLEPMPGARVELRRGKRSIKRELFGPITSQLFLGPLEDRPAGTYVLKGFGSEGDMTPTSHRISDLLDSLEVDDHGWAEIERPVGPFHLLGYSGLSSGFVNVGESDSAIELLIEKPIRVQALDGNGRQSPTARVEVVLHTGKNSHGRFLTDERKDGIETFRGLWRELRKEGMNDSMQNAGIDFRLRGNLFEGTQFFPIDEMIPDPVVLREEPSASVLALVPWLDAVNARGDRISLVEDSSAGKTVAWRQPGNRHFERIPLNMRLRLHVGVGQQRVVSHAFSGPSTANQLLRVTVPPPKRHAFVEAWIYAPAAIPSMQRAEYEFFLRTENGQQVMSKLDYSGGMFFVARVQPGSGVQAQIWRNASGRIVVAPSFALSAGVGARKNLGTIYFKPAPTLLRVRAVDEEGRALREARIRVHECLERADGPKWKVSKSLQSHIDPDTGIAEIRGPVVHRRFRVRACYLDGYENGEWVDCRPGAGVVDLVMRKR